MKPVLLFLLALVCLLSCQSRHYRAAIKAECLNVHSAVENYRWEMGAYPLSASYSVLHEGDISMSGRELAVSINSNPRGLRFLKSNVLHHPCGKDYTVILDADEDGKILFEGKQYRESVIVFSCGEDDELISSLPD